MNDSTLATGLLVHCIYIGSNYDHWLGCYMSQSNLEVIWATYHNTVPWAMIHQVVV